MQNFDEQMRAARTTDEVTKWLADAESWLDLTIGPQEMHVVRDPVLTGAVIYFRGITTTTVDGEEGLEDAYLRGYRDCEQGKQFHETPFPEMGGPYDPGHSARAREWRRGWNDAALERAPQTIEFPARIVESADLSIHLTLQQFIVLPEYSTSLPTGLTAGKRWRRREPAYREVDPGSPVRWFMGEYFTAPTGKNGTDNRVGLRWYSIILVGNLRANMKLLRGKHL